MNHTIWSWKWHQPLQQVYIENWTNKEINHKLSNHFWNAPRLRNTQIIQLLKFQFVQYLGNHVKSLFLSQTYTNPDCTLCYNNDNDTWPHLLSLCNNKFLKGLRIARHNVTTHQLTNLLKSNEHIRHLTLTSVGKQHGNQQDNTTLSWILRCTCNNTQCECLAKLQPDVVYIHGATYKQNDPLIPTPNLTIQSIEFTFTHDKFIEQSIQTKETNYNPLIDAIKAQGTI